MSGKEIDMLSASGPHRFGRPRLSAETLTLSIANSAAFSSRPFQPLPPPPGKEPFRLEIADILPAGHLAAITVSRKLVFHIGGDAGGIKDAVPQQLVANGMERDFPGDATHPENDPAFFYMLGDCVYFNGQATEYFAQFYQPYEHYLAPIFAVPGNHDGDAVAPETSLDAFVRNFCATDPGTITPEAGESTRTAMIQPNVFWTLRTPLVTIIGLYTNVPEGGDIHPDQQSWLVSEMMAAPKDWPLFLTMHHPVLSADDHHSGSQAMQRALTDAVASSKRVPDIVFGGHVHNYQRFTRVEGEREVPYIVAGASGYHNLHNIVKVNGQKIVPPARFGQAPGAPMLESYVDTRHGFLRIEVTETAVQGKYYTVARPQEPWSDPPRLADVWELDWRAHRMRVKVVPTPSMTIDSSIAALREPRQQYGANIRATAKLPFDLPPKPSPSTEVPRPGASRRTGPRSGRTRRSTRR